MRFEKDNSGMMKTKGGTKCRWANQVQKNQDQSCLFSFFEDLAVLTCNTANAEK